MITIIYIPFLVGSERPVLKNFSSDTFGGIGTTVSRPIGPPMPGRGFGASFPMGFGDLEEQFLGGFGTQTPKGFDSEDYESEVLRGFGTETFGGLGPSPQGSFKTSGTFMSSGFEASADWLKAPGGFPATNAGGFSTSNFGGFFLSSSMFTSRGCGGSPPEGPRVTELPPGKGTRQKNN